MAAFNLLEPITPEMPCGPDLEQRDDPDFLDYYYEAESRLPERYFTPGLAPDGREDRQFDPRSVDLAAETAAIHGLLKRTRDLRLVSLLARFQILAGKLEGFADTLEDMAAILGQWPDEVHPRGADRRAAMDSLNSQPAVVMPLLHLPVLSNSELTLRRYMVATGKAEPRAGERELVGTDILSPLRVDANHKAVAVVQDRLSRASDALHRIQKLAASHPDTPLTLDLGALRAALTDMQTMIAQARPDLQPWSPTAIDPQPDPAPEEPAPSSDAQAVPAAAPKPAQRVPDRATAAVTLDAVARWLAGNEPSSPALVLVAQARALVGKPLVEAIEVLMPAQAPGAKLRIGQGSPFILSMDKLKALTQNGLDGQGGGDPAPAPITPPSIGRRADIVSQLLGVEGYFSAFEPASPVPLLLAKAREMLDKRFDAIVAELLASQVEPGQG
ncbi:ImpA family type VI secretion system protein [Paracoccus sp. (in: a-proteobacteria)]|uniref:type VI secretion system protein TssA n=1 Tax=Paracoccus sp. TaxID=267 RepID=UPI0035AE33C9